MSLPKLNELLKHEFMLVLGAGASKDYNFPLWDDLKKDLKTELEKESDSDKSFDQKMKKKWALAIKDSPNKTIDAIILTKNLTKPLRKMVG